MLVLAKLCNGLSNPRILEWIPGRGEPETKKHDVRDFKWGKKIRKTIFINNSFSVL
jgi:hypothetical protein